MFSLLLISFFRVLHGHCDASPEPPLLQAAGVPAACLHRTLSFTSDRPAGLRAPRVTRPRPAPRLLTTQVPSDSTEKPSGPASQTRERHRLPRSGDLCSHSAPDPAPPRRACSHAAGSPTYLGWRTDSEKTTWRYHTTPLRALSTTGICPLPHRARAFGSTRPAPWRKLPLPACRAALARQDGIGALCGAGYGGGFAQQRASAGPQRQ